MPMAPAPPMPSSPHSSRPESEETAIRSESQYLDRDWTTKLAKYTLHQQWTVKVSPERAAEILDVAYRRRSHQQRPDRVDREG